MPCDVLLLTNLYPPIQIGGYEIAARDVAEGLRDRGVSVHVLASDYRASEFQLQESDVSRTLKLTGSWFGDYHVNSPFDNSKLNFVRTKELLVRIRPRLVYAWNQANLGAGPIVAAQYENIPILHHVMGYDILSYRRRCATVKATVKEVLRRIRYSAWRNYRLDDQHLSQIIFLSRFMEDYYRREGVCPAFSKVIYPGIAVDTIRCKDHYQINDGVVDVAFLGQLAPHKGVLEVKSALHNLAVSQPERKFRLTLLGTGEENFVRKLIQPAAVEVVHRGFVSRGDLYQQLADYDIGVFSSTWEEPFGIAQIEMMAAGLPLVSSGTGGAAEPLDNMENALVYNAKDPEDMERKFAFLIGNYENLAKHLGQTARKTIEGRFSLEVMHASIFETVSRLMPKQ